MLDCNLLMDCHTGRDTFHHADLCRFFDGRDPGRQTRFACCIDLYYSWHIWSACVFRLCWRSRLFNGGHWRIYHWLLIFNAYNVGDRVFFGRSIVVLRFSMALGLLVCYAFGTVWFITVYAHQTGAISIAAVCGICVVPFIIPDCIKISFALYIIRRLMCVKL